MWVVRVYFFTLFWRQFSASRRKPSLCLASQALVQVKLSVALYKILYAAFKVLIFFAGFSQAIQLPKFR